MRVSKWTYNKCFKILFAVFAVCFSAEFIFTALGIPISDIRIIGLDLDQDLVYIWALRSAIAASTISGFVNYFLILKILKEKLGILRWPAFAIVLMVIFIPIEILISDIAVIPSLIIFGILGRVPKGFAKP